VNRLLTILFCATVAGCSPWNFALQKDTGWDIDGRIYDAPHLVDASAANMVSVTSPASIAIRCEELTDGTFDSEMTLSGGNVRLRLRSTPYNDSVRRTEPYIDIVIDQSSTTILHDGTSTRVASPLPEPGTPFRIFIRQFGKYIDVEVACAKVGRFETSHPSTQWISVIPGEGATVELRDPKFAPIRDEYSEATQR